ncbi:MAG: hypothetical protein ACRC3B_03545, partial [Bacteroidia bacterium]
MKNLFLLISAVIVMQGCRRGNPSWETGIGVPVAHGSFGINQLIADSLTSTGASGVVYVDHTFELNNLGTDTLFNIPDTTLRYTYFSFLNSQISPGSTIWSQNTTTRYQLGVVELMNTILRKGTMRIAVKNDLTQPIDLRIVLPGATLNNQVLDTLLIIAAAPNSQNARLDTFEIDISGYTIDLRGPQFNQINTLTTQYTIKVSTTATASANIAAYTDSMSMNMTLTGIVPEYVRGYFGNQTLQAGPEETATGIFDLITSGGFGLDSLT